MVTNLNRVSLIGLNFSVTGTFSSASKASNPSMICNKYMIKTQKTLLIQDPLFYFTNLTMQETMFFDGWKLLSIKFKDKNYDG